MIHYANYTNIWISELIYYGGARLNIPDISEYLYIRNPRGFHNVEVSKSVRRVQADKPNVCNTKRRRNESAPEQSRQGATRRRRRHDRDIDKVDDTSGDVGAGIASDAFAALTRVAGATS